MRMVVTVAVSWLGGLAGVRVGVLSVVLGVDDEELKWWAARCVSQGRWVADTGRSRGQHGGEAQESQLTGAANSW